MIICFQVAKMVFKHTRTKHFKEVNKEKVLNKGCMFVIYKKS
jgi:hypothetical protein